MRADPVKSPETAAADEKLLDRFRRAGALHEGHFLLSSGLHSPVYFQSALLLQHPPEAERAARELARRLRRVLDPAASPSAVLAPALGGIVIGHELARALGWRAVFAERDDGRMALRRGFGLTAGERVVVCEDVVTTGGSAAEVVRIARAAGARVSAVAALIHRGASVLDLGVPLVSLARLPSPAYEARECPLCARGLPIVKPGSRGTNAGVSR